MFKKYRFYIGLTLLVQSASFVVLFFLLYSKKKSLANTFLALSAIGGLSGAYLVLKEAKNEVEACEQAAKDACEYNGCGEAFDFDACDDCMCDCEDCLNGEPECEITIEEYIEEEPVLEEIAEVVEAVVDAAVEEEPAQDIFVNTVEA